MSPRGLASKSSPTSCATRNLGGRRRPRSCVYGSRRTALRLPCRRGDSTAAARAIVPLRAVRDRCEQILGVFDDDLVLDVLAIGREREALDDVLRGARRQIERKAVGMRRVADGVDDERAALPAPDRMPVQRRLERGGMIGEVEMDDAPSVRDVETGTSPRSQSPQPARWKAGTSAQAARTECTQSARRHAPRASPQRPRAPRRVSGHARAATARLQSPFPAAPRYPRDSTLRRRRAASAGWRARAAGITVPSAFVRSQPSTSPSPRRFGFDLDGHALAVAERVCIDAERHEIRCRARLDLLRRLSPVRAGDFDLEIDVRVAPRDRP